MGSPHGCWRGSWADLSKKHGHRKKRRRKKSRRPPGNVLDALAAALNACETAGVKVRFRHGAAFSREGVVLPPDKGGRWEARTFSANPLAPPEAPDDLDD